MKEQSYSDVALTALRLDARRSSHYVWRMQRWLIFLLIALFALPLAGCGIKGGLKTPPPLWGDEVAQLEEGVTEEDVESEDELEDLTYGVDVSNNP